MKEIKEQKEKEISPEILFKKVKEIQEIRQKQIQEEKSNLDFFGLAKEIKKFINEMPDDLKKEVWDDVKEFQKLGMSTEKIFKRVKLTKERNMIAYRDKRTVIDMYNKEYAAYILNKTIDEKFKNRNLSPDDFLKIARINLDMNGLKALNDFGDHKAGDEGLKAFSEILKNGKTTEWLENLGFEVAATSEGGDEFGIVIYNDKNLFEEIKIGNKSEKLIDEIQKKYFEEIKNFDASKLIDFSLPEVQKRLENAGIEVSENFKYEISTSIGAVSFGEALLNVSWQDGDDYKKIIKKISDQMFKIADEKAINNKNEYKKRLRETNETLYKLYERPSEEEGKLRIENKILCEKIERLEKELKLTKIRGELSQ